LTKPFGVVWRNPSASFDETEGRRQTKLFNTAVYGASCSNLQGFSHIINIAHGRGEGQLLIIVIVYLFRILLVAFAAIFGNHFGGYADDHCDDKQDASEQEK
jgi:hypothetical protein